VATASGTSQISVTWAQVSGASSYSVYRSLAANVQVVSGNKIATTTVASLVDTGLAESTAYFYKVTALNATGESTASSEVSATTAASSVAAPIAPIGLAVSVTSATHINVSWGVRSDATSYQLYRSTSPSVQIVAGNRIATLSGSGNNTYGDSGLTAATPYYYRVTAVNAGGEGAASAEVAGTTSAASSSGSAVGTGLYTAVTAQDNASFLALLNTACPTKTVIQGGIWYQNCTQPTNAAFAVNLSWQMYVGGLPHQTGGAIVAGPTSAGGATVNLVLGTMSGAVQGNSCTIGVAEPVIPIVLVQSNGLNFYASGANFLFGFKGTADDSITVTDTGVVSEYTMTNASGNKIEIHPNLALFGTGSGAEAALSSDTQSSNYLLCK
jgi:fibronectin type 3 domain-containing protein